MPDWSAACPDPGFVALLAARAPHTPQAARAAVDEFVAGLDDDRLREVVNRHDPIGLPPEHGFSRGEQAAVLAGDPDTLAEIARLDALYRERVGAVFLIRVAGLSAADVLAALRTRIARDPAAELSEIRVQLAAILAGRLERMITGPVR
ncbi:2-oxo-4-hydroxy-4-carboxy-5-ureidoimidazoline decarboxylase [Pseudonocardia sp. WMMC193]|uniref:2-oxo-4-hydroxy-4-carboxy-5-ureidoimidazoline decarboxylase n=1 Tax=Pseudonocardia sp. WMMC193 TaxID=2911965 RepID=UPI001F22D9DC|nr:2-oxo-4-hydroxy-4-carboxy-5-ureidoimidazoline decarboxylase [Pseudonocardia sp. WMMC193]MCF7547539.1 2-oxo-4-hydroxy-4-carboxy-5-ureidoimidazoline decarboxylase [Pseudonocardia sp. WMMC193]